MSSHATHPGNLIAMGVNFYSEVRIPLAALSRASSASSCRFSQTPCRAERYISHQWVTKTHDGARQTLENVFVQHRTFGARLLGCDSS